MKYLLLPVFLFVCLLASLGAESITLKGANGKEATFNLQSVTMAGVEVQPQNSYKTLLIQWGQLDLAWLEKHQPMLWKRKQAVEAMGKRAYDGFQFGQSRNEVIVEVNRMKAVQVPAQNFGDTSQDILWVCADPDTLRRFMRFRFDTDKRLTEFEVHMNFDSDEAIEKGMKNEWERLIRMVETFDVHPNQRDRFPTSSSWRQFVRNAEKGGESRILSRTWNDDLRHIELSLEAKQVELSTGEAKPGKVALFGVEIDTSSVVSTASNTNWVVYKAQFK
jgi:hypothetical protein